MKVIIKGQDGLDLEYDTKDITILIMLTAHDADRIRNMPAGQGANYCVHPDGLDTNKVQEWMNQRVSQVVKEEEKEEALKSQQPPPGLSPN